VSPAGRCAAQTPKEAASPPLTFTRRLPRSRPGDAPREGTGPPLQRQGCCASRCDGPSGAGLERWSLCGPSGRKYGQALACPAWGAARPVTPCPAHKRTPGNISELAFDSQKKRRNYTNPLTGSVHAFRGLPDILDLAWFLSVNDRRYLLVVCRSIGHATARSRLRRWLPAACAS